MPSGVVATPRPRQITPDAGTVVASGRFVWPTQGVITQRFSWYHPGIDIANNAEPLDVAADSGRVEYAGWDASGYGNMILIDHGNGYQTLYGHMVRVKAKVGQSVKRGEVIGYIGNTGKSTGPHCHYEVIKRNIKVDPVYYFYNDLTPAQFDRLLKAAANNKQSLD
jgi:murein DD-endopeptidase MepM/ murein hydrolase activator NlpD